MSFFDPNQTITRAEAPGRLDVMGGIADYSGSLLLQMPIAETTVVELQERADNLFQLQSLKGTDIMGEFTFDITQLAGCSLEEAGQKLKAKKGGDWAAYVIGCFVVLQQKKGFEPKGMNIRIQSTVPSGKGVSSSAALEVATMHAIGKHYGVQLEGYELPLLAQLVENVVVGAACGLMDQLAVHFGEKEALLPIICQPYQIESPIAIPAAVRFCGIDSGVRHAVGSASYGDVRTAAFMAYSIIALQEGATRNDLERAKQSGRLEQLPYGGYLANMPLSRFQQQYENVLPSTIKGQEFLAQYGLSIDPVTQVVPGSTYQLRACAQHPVYEMDRVQRFRQLLLQLEEAQDAQPLLEEMGALMVQSHRSYSAVGLGNSATDEIVETVLEKGTASGLYGARISGGGNGGTVVVMCGGMDGLEAAKMVHRHYAQKWGKNLHFFTGSNRGAASLNTGRPAQSTLQ